jgi:hypothetical protein
MSTLLNNKLFLLVSGISIVSYLLYNYLKLGDVGFVIYIIGIYNLIFVICFPILIFLNRIPMKSEHIIIMSFCIYYYWQIGKELISYSK